jgi:hypothetical protein
VVFRDGTRDQPDTILALSVLVGKKPQKPLFMASEVSGDKKIGLEESIFDLGVVSGLNPSSESEVFFYDTDYLGTSITLSSLSGNVVWQVDELPFGEEYEQDGIPDINKRRYIGKEKDKETGLHPYRYVDPDGRSPRTPRVGPNGRPIPRKLQNSDAMARTAIRAQQSQNPNYNYRSIGQNNGGYLTQRDFGTITSRETRRQVMRDAGIPTSQQPVSQISTRVPDTNQPWR